MALAVLTGLLIPEINSQSKELQDFNLEEEKVGCFFKYALLLRTIE